MICEFPKWPGCRHSSKAPSRNGQRRYATRNVDHEERRAFPRRDPSPSSADGMLLLILSNSLLETQCQADDCFAFLQEISSDLNTIPNDSFKLSTAVYKFVSTSLHCGCRH